MRVNKTTGSHNAAALKRAEKRQEAKAASEARGHSAQSGFELSPEDKQAQKSIDEMLSSLDSRDSFKSYTSKLAGEANWESDLDRRKWESSRKGLPSDALRRVQDKTKKEYEKLKAQGLSPSEISEKLEKFMNAKLNFEEYNKSFFDDMMARLKELNPWKD